MCKFWQSYPIQNSTNAHLGHVTYEQCQGGIPHYVWRGQGQGQDHHWWMAESKTKVNIGRMGQRLIAKARSDLVVVEAWGSPSVRPPSSAGPLGASSSGAASSSSSCPARSLWLQQTRLRWVQDCTFKPKHFPETTDQCSLIDHLIIRLCKYSTVGA